MDQYDVDNILQTPKTSTSRSSPSGPTSANRPSSWTPSLSFLEEDATPTAREELEPSSIKRGAVPGGLEFMFRNIGNTETGHYPAGETNLTSYHMVRGRKRHGLLHDLGAASGIIGTDTVREYQRDIISDTIIETRPATSKFAGIDGPPTPGIGKVVVPLQIPVLKGATFTGDVIGDLGSFFPALLPRQASMRYRAVMFAIVFPKGDNILTLFPQTLAQMDGKREPTPICMRRLLAEPGRYIAPVDDVSVKGEIDQKYLREHVMRIVNWFASFKQSSSPSRSPTVDFHEVETPLDTGTGAKVSEDIHEIL